MDNMEKIYRNRITDSALELKLEAFGATLIVGPKGCGKTTTAKHFANSYIEFQDEDAREGLLSVAENMPSKLLIGDKPRLFDEWQDAPKIWGAIRKDVDDPAMLAFAYVTPISALIHLCDREPEKTEDAIGQIEAFSRHFIATYGVK